MTLLLRRAEEAAEVTMVQRSPTHIGAKPDVMPLSSWTRKVFPLSWVVVWERFYHVATCYLLVLFCRAFSQAAKGIILKEVAAALPEDVKVKPYFEPNYMPWDQRLWLASGGDFFKTFHRKNARVVTGEIDTVTEHRIRMKDGTSVEADAIITATGRHIKLRGGVDLTVDGDAVSWGKRVAWNCEMLDGIPNLVFMIGFTDGAWTIGADAAAMILVSILRNMRRTLVASLTPRAPRDAIVETRRIWTTDATYRHISDHRLPVYGVKGPLGSRRVSPFADYLH